MIEISWAEKYFRKDDITRCVGTYIALLVLRFERRSNYEKIIDIDEILQPVKNTLSILLGPSASYRAYMSGRGFIEELFSRDSRILQASIRFKVLEDIESRYYSVIRRNYLYLVENEVDRLPRQVRYILYRVLTDVKYGKLPVIDRTCAGSCYVSRLDITSKYVKGSIESLNELIEDFAKAGIIKPSYLRVIIPAPLLEDCYIRRLIGGKQIRDLLSTLDSIFKTFGYYRTAIEDVKASIGDVVKLVYEKKINDNVILRFEVYYTMHRINKKCIEEIFNNYRGSVLRLFISETDIDEEIMKILRELGIPVIKIEGKENEKYIIEKILQIILDISSLSALAQIKSMMEELLELLY